LLRKPVAVIPLLFNLVPSTVFCMIKLDAVADPALAFAHQRRLDFLCSSCGHSGQDHGRAGVPP
jgi:hypothetical protein